MPDSQLSLAKESQHLALQVLAHSLCLFLHALVENACLPRRKHQGVNVRLPADHNGVARFFSDFFRRGYNARSKGALTWDVWQRRIQHQFKRSQRSTPGSKILGGKFSIHGFAEIAIHLLRPDRMPPAIIIQILKRCRPRSSWQSRMVFTIRYYQS